MEQQQQSCTNSAMTVWHFPTLPQPRLPLSIEPFPPPMLGMDHAMDPAAAVHAHLVRDDASVPEPGPGRDDAILHRRAGGSDAGACSTTYAYAYAGAACGAAGPPKGGDGGPASGLHPFIRSRRLLPPASDHLKHTAGHTC